MADLAKALHMSKSSIYKLIDSKDDLIHAMVSNKIESFQAEMKSLDQVECDMIQKIKLFVKAYLEFIHPLMASGFYRDLEFSYPEEFQRLQAFYKEQVDYVGTLLQKGIEAGTFRPLPLAVIQHTLYVSTAALLDENFLKENHLTYEQVIESLEELLFHGILQDKA